jgi:hypothetical protein
MGVLFLGVWDYCARGIAAQCFAALPMDRPMTIIHTVTEGASRDRASSFVARLVEFLALFWTLIILIKCSKQY